MGNEKAKDAVYLLANAIEFMKSNTRILNGPCSVYGDYDGYSPFDEGYSSYSTMSDEDYGDK